ncbi:MAG TPA: hypothetical protein VEC13_01090 [Candidatus Paceibacterota bacterium]|nr:hypothetical protein [Candidatus Paceibacterota bacterium]
MKMSVVPFEPEHLILMRKCFYCDTKPADRLIIIDDTVSTAVSFACCSNKTCHEPENLFEKQKRILLGHNA